MLVEIGDVVTIADSSAYSGNPSSVSGLIVGGTTTSVTFDRPITVTGSGTTFKFVTFGRY